MLKRYCNKCTKEIPEGSTYYNIDINRIGPDITGLGFEVSIKEIKMDICEDCFKNMIEQTGVKT